MNFNKKNFGKIEDILSLPIYGRYEYGIRVNCPYCISSRGKDDRDGKFYFNESKKVGFCFKCETRVVGDLSYIDEDIIKNNIVKIISEEEDLLEKYKKQLYLIEDWHIEIKENDVFFEYLKKRKICVNTLRNNGYNVFGCKIGSINGILFCNNIIYTKYGKATDFFQIRFITDKKNFRHFHNKNSVKPICFLSNVKTDKIIICEGFFSAISSMIYSNLSSVVLVGKNLTTFQLEQLSNFSEKKKIKEIIICLDGGYNKEAKSIYKKLYQKEIGEIISFVELPNDKDPNDLEEKEFLDCFLNRKTFSYET